MAFLSLSDLVQRCVIRLRQVPGVTTQSYAEDHLAIVLEECYEQCRALRWWDHLTQWQTRTLNGTTGRVTAPFFGARERMRDVQGVYVDSRQTPLPFVNVQYNPSRYTGTIPRAIQPLSVTDDPSGEYLFGVWPLASTGTVAVRLRADPPGLFATPTSVIPFDATALVNGACMKYAMTDGTNPAAVAEFDRAYNERVEQMLKQHDSVPLVLDARQDRWQDQWREEFH